MISCCIKFTEAFKLNQYYYGSFDTFTFIIMIHIEAQHSVHEMTSEQHFSEEQRVAHSNDYPNELPSICFSIRY